jgi:hypothetical protein
MAACINNQPPINADLPGILLSTGVRKYDDVCAERGGLGCQEPLRELEGNGAAK